jgi:hypothetical protein
MSTSIDPAFANIKDQGAGLYIWRIEQLKPVPVEKEGYGKFFAGDSYICLEAKQARKTSSALSYNIHFWLGEATTHDEMGACAYKTCELDDALGGMAKQHRETQGHESSKFLAIFKKLGGVCYLEGGAESGFKHVEGKEYPTRLLHLKGRRNVRVKQVEAAASSLNEGDVFILDMGLDLFQWNGAECNKMEKAKALATLTLLRDDRGAKPKIHVIESSEGAAGERGATFWEALGGYPGADGIAGADAGGDDREEERKAKKEIKLFKVSDASGEMTTEQIASAKLKRDMLDSSETFVLDTGTALFVWVGKQASREEKSQAFITANTFLVTNERPAWTPVSLVIDQGETAEFKSYFWQWDPPAKPRDWSTHASAGVASSVEQKEVDVAALAGDNTSARLRASSMQVDDGSGKTEVWRIEDMAKVEVPADKFGQFYSGDSYIVLYTYRPEGKSRDAYIIYFWQGRKSTADEKGASALFATKMDDDLGGSPVQVRVVQGKEPSHFCSLFKGKMVIHDGGKASGFKNSKQEDESDDDGVSLFHVRGTNEHNTRAVQVAEVTASLNSGDCFVLLTPGTIYSWNGTGSNDAERSTGLTVAQTLSTWGTDTAREVVVLTEGEDEPDAFWAPLGGKGEYSSSPELQDQPREPRLFELSNMTGAVEVNEVFSFSQDDLLQDDVMLLDVYNALYVWVGNSANDTEKKAAAEVSRKYIAACAETDGRDASTNIITIKAGSEPPMFTCHFLGWDAKAAEVFVDPYEKRCKELKSTASFAVKPSWAKKQLKHTPDPEMTKVEEEGGGESKAAAPEEAEEVAAPAAAAAATPVAAPTEGSFTYAQLKGNPCEVHDEIEKSKKEQYLSSAEFQEVFKMDKAAFEKLAGWKQKKAKLAVGLF